MKEIREQLQDVEGELRRLREERGRASGVFQTARKTAEQDENDGTLATAMRAKQAVAEIDELIEAATDRQIRLLKSFGDAEANLPGFTGAGNGWQQAARELDLESGKLRVDLAGASLTRPMAQAQPGGGAGSAGTATSVSLATTEQRAASRTVLYPWALPQESFATGSPFVRSDYTVSFSTAALSGVERAVDATSTKADLGATVANASPAARMFAVTASGLPQRVFDTQVALQALLEQEMRRRIDLELDTHVISTINAASPATGSPAGTGLIAKSRAAVAAHRALGSSPSVMAISPAASSALDLTQLPSGGEYIFAIRESSGSPLWSLTVVESAAVADNTALLLDPGRLGVLLVGNGSITADPLTGLAQNTIRLRVELEMKAHIRSAVGAYSFTF